MHAKSPYTPTRRYVAEPGGCVVKSSRSCGSLLSSTLIASFAVISLWPCQVLAFTYNSKPRVCMVVQVAETWFRAEMADDSGFRCFSFDKIESDITLVAEPE